MIAEDPAAIAGHLHRAAWWPDDESRRNDRLGEFSSYSIEFKCRDFRTLYVRVESEPYRSRRGDRR